MNGFLLDTHVWLWHVDGSMRLPPSLRRLIDSPRSTCWLSPVSIWEASRLVQRGKISLRRSFAEWLETTLFERPLQDASLSREVGRAAATIQLPHGDPVDHLLVGTALAYDLVLLTLDRELVRAKVIRTRSK